MMQMHAPYQALQPGLNQIKLCDGRITLVLSVGDISEQLPHITTNADAWFLDGFAPAKNSAMWSPELFISMARLSQINTSFATFTSAAQIRKALFSAGFHVSKAPGFGKKREMLYGCYA